MQKKYLSLLLTLVGIYLFSDTLYGQSVWVDHDNERAVFLEILKPDCKHFDNPKLDHMVASLTQYWAAEEDISFVIELPVSRIHARYRWLYSNMPGYSVEEFTLGNIYIGIRNGGRHTISTFTLGLRWPLSKDEAELAREMGLDADRDRYGAFTHKLMTISTNYFIRGELGDSTYMRFGLGASLSRAIDSRGGAAYIDFNYNLLFWLKLFSIRLGTGLAGTTTAFQFGITGNGRIGRFEPGINFRLPLDRDFRERISYIFGFSLGFRY